MDISMGLDTKPTDHHPSEKQGSFTIEAASPCEDVDMATPSAVSLNHSPKVTTLKGAKNNIMIGATPLPHPLSMSTESNSLHHFQTNAASPMYTTPTSNSAYVHAALGPLLTDSAATVPSSATAAFMALHGHTIGVYESPRRNSVPTLTADQVEHKRKVSSEEKTLHRQASWSNFSSLSTPLSSFPTTTSLPNLHQINTAHVDPNMMQYYRTQFSQQQALHHNSPHHSLNQALPPSTNSSACPSPMPESLMHGSVLNSINSSPVAGAGSKKFGRSDNHSTLLKSQSRRGAKAGGAAERRRRAASRPIEGRRGSGSGDDAIKKEVEDTDELQPVLSSQDPRDPEGLSSMAHHHHHIHGYGAMHRGHGDHDDDYSPTRSPGGTPLGQPSSMGEDEHFGLISHSGYSTFANNTLYSMNDPMEHLSGMVPRFDHIRLDLKSVAPSDIHKSSCAYEDESSGSGNPNGESPHASPMPHYEHFAFPSSISTHFMPMMNGGFSMDNSDIHHSQHSLHHPSSAGPDSASPSSYSSLPSADSSASSASSFHLHHHHGYHPDGYQFGANGLHSMNSDLHYPPASPMNEDGSMNPHHSHQHHSHHHHPHPLHSQSFHHSQPHHSDFYDSKAANPQMLHHPFPSLQHPSASALPPHPLMSTSPFTAPGGLNEPLYSSTSSTSSSSSLGGSRATTTPDIINSNGSNASTKSASSSSSSSTTSSTNGASGSTNAGSGSSGGGSKHGGSGKHHTCSEIGCSKRFKRLEHLKRHIKTHTLERPFNCPYATCTKKFSRSDNLSQHVKTHQRQLNKLQMKQRNQAQVQQQQQQAQQQAVHS
ncbi:hypothetical protein BGX30_001550 [Mortierella sp. GBA39]|nr:hypothetical protein BGX30_001550 [Mortierella sp. GBA39]